MAVVALIAAGVIGGLIVHWTSSNSGSGTTAQAASGARASACDAKTVSRETLPSVVTIAVQGASASGTGSGEVIRITGSNGYIVTNNHVVSPAANGGQVQVIFNDGSTAAATIVGRDPATDLAVIRVSDSNELHQIPIGNSAGVQVGQPVIALGAPLGLSSTVTAGIVSALGRTISVPGDNNGSALLIDAIQTDAAINPGNSGGALVNCSGQLIGIPSAGASVPNESGGSSSGSVGLGFAIPVDLAKTISNELISTGKVVHASFGVETTQVTPEVAASNNLPQGLFVSQVTPGGPASSAGLQNGDVITKLDGTAATSELLAELSLRKRPGATVKVAYKRNGQANTVTLTLGAEASTSPGSGTATTAGSGA